MSKAQLIETVITPEYVNDAKPGKATGSLKVGDQYYNVPAEHVRFFHVGTEYKIAYATKDYSGREFRFVRQVHAGDKWMPVEADKPLGGAQTPAQGPAQSTTHIATPATTGYQRPSQAEYGAVTQKEMLIWVESYVKSYAPSQAGMGAKGEALTCEAIEIFDLHIRPWLEGRAQDGPGDRERAVKGGGIWNDSVEPPGFPEGYGG